MREYKFRGQRVDTKEWVYGYLVKTNETTFICYADEFNDDLFLSTENIFIEVIPETVGQYTELNDKNGKEVYEGDFCTRSLYGITHKSTFSIHYHDKHCAFAIADIDGRVKTFLHDITHTHDIEVIGNIFDNADLLTEGAKL